MEVSETQIMKSTSILSFPAKGLIGTRPTRFPAGFFTRNFDSVGCLVSFHCTSYFFCISFRCIFGSQSSFVFPTIRSIFHARRRPSYASHCALHAFASSCFIFPLKMFKVVETSCDSCYCPQVPHLKDRTPVLRWKVTSTATSFG